MQSHPRTLDPSASWDDYRLLLLAIRTSSFQSAAAALGVATSTVSRKLGAWEKRIGAPLFERRPHGVSPTAAGRLLGSIARTLEAEMERGETRVAHLDTGLSGVARLTAGEGLGEALVPMVAEFRALYPQIEVELAIDARTYDLAKGEADLAIRMVRPSGRGLRVRKLGSVELGLFASRAYLERRGTPRSLRDLEQHEFVGVSGDLAAMLPGKFLQEIGAVRFSVRVNSTPLVRLATLSSLGIGLLSNTTTDLVRVLPDLTTPPIDVWLARHSMTRGVRRVDRLADFLFERVSRVAREPRARP